jgi:hypothetical protein
MCDSQHHVFLCEIPRNWPYEIVKTKNIEVKVYKQLELIRKDGKKIDQPEFCLIHIDDETYMLYVLTETKSTLVVQCSWKCHDITSQFKTLVKIDNKKGESKENDTKTVRLCALEYEWLDFSRIIGNMNGYSEDMFGNDIFSKTFISNVLSKNIVNFSQDIYII